MLVPILRCITSFAPPQCQARVEINMVSGSSAAFNLEVAKTMLQRSLGMMERAVIHPDGGMLLLYPWSRTVRIWMANTPLSLDVIFANARGEVVKVDHQLESFSRQWVSSGQPVSQVIELVGGTAERLGITAGAKVRIIEPGG